VLNRSLSVSGSSPTASSGPPASVHTPPRGETPTPQRRSSRHGGRSIAKPSDPATGPNRPAYCRYESLSYRAGAAQRSATPLPTPSPQCHARPHRCALPLMTSWECRSLDRRRTTLENSLHRGTEGPERQPHPGQPRVLSNTVLRCRRRLDRPGTYDCPPGCRKSMAPDKASPPPPVVIRFVRLTIAVRGDRPERAGPPLQPSRSARAELGAHAGCREDRRGDLSDPETLSASNRGREAGGGTAPLSRRRSPVATPASP
jgi:hypothetical protein